MAATSMLFPGPRGYDCARRFRHKMLLSYLSQQRLFPTFQSMLQQTDAHMCGGQLRRLVSRGQWAEALGYISRFNSRKSVVSIALHFFLHTLWALDNVAAGARDGSVKSSAHQHSMALSTVICRCPKLRSIVKSMVDSPQQCVSLDWGTMRVTAATIAYYLAREDPDLYRLMQLPEDGQMLPLLPISRRRHVKRPHRRRPPGRGPAIARLYLSKRRSLRSSDQHTPVAAFIDESLNRVADLVDECLKAGKPQKLQSVGRVPAFLLPLRTAPGASVSQTNSGTTSVPNTGAPASAQIMPGITNQAKNSGISTAQVSGVHVRV